MTVALRWARSSTPISPTTSPGPSSAIVSPLLHPGRALLDDEHVVGVVALAHELLALGHADLGHEVGDVAQLFVVDVGEDRDLLQARRVHGGVCSSDRIVVAGARLSQGEGPRPWTA